MAVARSVGRSVGRSVARSLGRSVDKMRGRKVFWPSCPIGVVVRFQIDDNTGGREQFPTVNTLKMETKTMRNAIKAIKAIFNAPAEIARLQSEIGKLREELHCDVILDPTAETIVDTLAGDCTDLTDFVNADAIASEIDFDDALSGLDLTDHIDVDQITESVMSEIRSRLA